MHPLYQILTAFSSLDRPRYLRPSTIIARERAHRVERQPLPKTLALSDAPFTAPLFESPRGSSVMRITGLRHLGFGSRRTDPLAFGPYGPLFAIG